MCRVGICPINSKTVPGLGTPFLEIYGVNKLPTLLLFDDEGRLMHMVLGPVSSLVESCAISPRFQTSLYKKDLRKL